MERIEKVKESRIHKQMHDEVIGAVLADLECRIVGWCRTTYDAESDTFLNEPPFDGTGYEHEVYIKYTEALKLYEVISKL